MDELTVYAKAWMSDGRFIEDGTPCRHKGCLNHKTHPCEGCGRILASEKAALKWSLKAKVARIAELNKIFETMISAHRCSSCYNPEDFICPACKAIDEYKALHSQAEKEE